jgi:uncharacterized protein YecE (DUF72 family)
VVPHCLEFSVTAYLVGTASWTDPTLIKSGLFYPPAARTPADRLAFYAAQFPTVEVDSTFYALPSEQNARLWAVRTPPGFVFNIKAFAWLTQHPAETTRLPKNIRESLAPSSNSAARIKAPSRELMGLAFKMFWSALAPLRQAGKLGFLLFQFPPYVTQRVSNFEYIASLPEQMPGAAIAVEFRHPSWFAGSAERASTLKFLRDNGMTLVAVDTPPAVGLPAVLEATTDDTYVRFHGRNRENWYKRTGGAAERFKYLYAERELEEWAKRLKEMRGAHRVFAIFNNCYSNFGIMNATTMSQILNR